MCAIFVLYAYIVLFLLAIVKVSKQKNRKTHKRNRMEVVNIYKYFIAEVKKQLSLKGWKYADLAKATGYTVGTIEAFMCGARESENMAKCIS